MAGAMNVQRVVTRQGQRLPQRHFKHVSHFAFVGAELHVRRDQADDRRDLKSGAAVERRHLAEYGNRLWRYRHFFLRFSQRRHDRRPVFSVGFTAGEGHLAGMFAQRVGAAGQQQRRLGATDDRDQHCGRAHIVRDLRRLRQLQLETADKGVQ